MKLQFLILMRWNILRRAGIFGITGILALSVGSQVFAATTAGFSSGNLFHTRNLDGQITVFCSGPGAGPHSAVWSCPANEVSPVAEDRFVAMAPADHLTLVDTHEDGGTTTKNAGFDAARGQSDVINLWLESLFQRPLLRVGVNRIHYSLTRAGTPVQAGDFVVTVVRDPDLGCRSETWQSLNEQDCTSSTQACQQYYRVPGVCGG